MYALTLYLLFFLIVVSCALGSYLGLLVIYLNSFILLLSFALTNFAVYEVLINNYTVNLNFYNWFYNLNVYFNFEFLFDQLSVVMLYIVLIISFFVHLFSIYYIKNDPNYNKFFFYLTSFTFFMSLLVLSNNFIQFFLGWEGIGLCSYLLINFWNTRLEANRSAIKAMVVNKIGDCSLYIFLIFYYFVFDNFDIGFNQVLSLNFNNFYILYFNVTIYDFMTFFIVLSCMAKSAQLGLHIWLPDAMEGPTPVSSLLHAATMVTAGVYMLLRISWIIDLSNFSNFLIIIGFLTNFFTSLVAIFQFDFKKIIAYSTASQIALMFISIGYSYYNLTFFHLFNHAFFKALLFLCAGVIIHNFKNIQDLRIVFNVYYKLPFTYISMIIGQLSLIGFPFMSSYYSKDLILYYVNCNLNFFSYIIFFFLNFSVFLTVFYSIRLLKFIFFNNFNYINKSSFGRYKNDYNFYYFVPLFILSFLSILSGYIFFDIFTNKIFFYFKNIFVFNFNSLFYNNFYNFFEYSDLLILFFTLIGIIGGFNIDYFVKKYNFFFNKNLYNTFILLSKKWFFDNLYYYIVLFFLNFFYIVVYKIIDKILLDYNFNNNIINFFKSFINYLSFLQKGYIYYYFFFLILLFICILFLFLFNQFIYLIFIFVIFNYINNVKI